MIGITHVAIRTHGHATESVERVKEALIHLVPFELKEKDIVLEHLTGSFGNPIRVFQIKFNSRSKIRSFIENLSRSLSEGDKRRLSDELELRLDDKNRFYIRIDKQPLMFDKIRLSRSSDSVQIVLSLSNPDPTDDFSLDAIASYLGDLDLLL